MSRHAAVDLGASSGRVVLADVGPDRLHLTEVHRFPHGPVRRADGYHWDLDLLLREVAAGLALLPDDVDTVGVDSWAVDYALLGPDGPGEPFSYRDDRVDRVRCPLTREELFARNGLQHLPFTTCYQLLAEPPGALDGRTMLLVPDLVVHALTGDVAAEVTNASTTGLLDARTRTWSTSTVADLGLPPDLLPRLVHPGDPRGRWQVGGPELVTVGSHDTASAVVGTPLGGARSAYVSVGTWGLVGVELDAPVLTPAVQRANVTNELGVDGTVRFLRNVMGLWLLQESMRTWGRDDLVALLAEAETLPVGPLFDVDDPSLVAPGDMPARIARLVGRALTPGEIVRSIVDSLAAAIAAALRSVVDLAGRDLDVVHVVGGGSQNSLLCREIARATGVPVVAGPVEATAIGNVLVQARAWGTVDGGLDALRDLVRRTQPTRSFQP